MNKHTKYIFISFFMTMSFFESVGQKITLNNIETKYNLKNEGVFDYNVEYKRTLGIYQNGYNETLNTPLWDAKINESEDYKEFLEVFKNNKVNLYPCFFVSKITNYKRLRYKFEDEVLDVSSWTHISHMILNYLSELSFDNIEINQNSDIIENSIYDKKFLLKNDLDTIDEIIKNEIILPNGYSVIPFFLQVASKNEYLLIEIRFYDNGILKFKSSVSIFTDFDKLSTKDTKHLYKEIVESLFYYL